MPAPSTDTPRVRRPAGVSRLGLAVAALASAGTCAVALIGLGGPPAPAAPVTPASADTTTSDVAGQQVVVKTIYVQLPAPTLQAPTSKPVAAAPKAVAAVVTHQSGSKGGEGGEQEGSD